jgi:O-antigen/teichoic acid export membrane protein
MLGAAVANLFLTIIGVLLFGFVGAAFASMLVFLTIAVVSIRLIRPFIDIRLPWREWTFMVGVSLLAALPAFFLPRVLDFAPFIEASIIGVIYVVCSVVLVLLGSKTVLRESTSSFQRLLRSMY